jgi:adenylate cyclase
LDETHLRQHLAAILAADAAGYSRLMAGDERGTLQALDEARRIFRSHIEANRGRVIDMAGDSVLAVFETATGAVSAALAVQQQLTEQGAALPADRRMAFRLGIHLGDVIEKADGSVYGDGVNIAARIQGLGEPGSVTVSDAVQGAIRERLAASFEDRGEHSVKNIARPVRVYRVRTETLLAAGPPVAPAVVTAAAARADKPAVAVLPFDNMSGDAEQEFFADGITEDIITELSRFRDLFVISRNSSFKYKGHAVDVQKFARELGVQYVVEGSVRKAGSRVRITVQLIDAETDRHLWAERYDRELADIFAIQDEVTQAIVATLPGRVEAASRERAARKTPDSLAAYEWVLTAKVLHHRSQREANAQAQEMLDRAIALDPKYAHAHAWKACVLGQTWVNGWCEDREATQERIFEELQTALALDDNDSDVHRILAAVHVIRNLHDLAQYHQQRALSLNPNDDLIVVQQGELLTWLGEAAQGVEWIRKAMRLNPYHPERFWSHLGRAHFVARDYLQAADAFRRITAVQFAHHAFLAACHARLGDATNARLQADAVLALAPAFTVDAYLQTLYYKRDEDRTHHRDSLLQAGLPA